MTKNQQSNTVCSLARDETRTQLRVRLQAITAQAAPLAKENSDAIHDARVASRRLRAALAEFRPGLPEEARSKFLDSARAVTRALGKARELDVTLALIEERLSTSNEDATPVLQAVREALRSQRASESTAVEEAATLLQSVAFVNPGNTLLDSAESWKNCYLKRATARLEKKRARLEKLYRKWRLTKIEEDLHAVRIQFKKLRYAAEIYQPLFGRPMKDALKSCKKAQESLGDWNDLRVLKGYIIEISAGDDFEAALFPIGHEVAAKLKEVTERLHSFFTLENQTILQITFRSHQQTCCATAAQQNSTHHASQETEGNSS